MPDLKSCPFCRLAAQRGAGAALGFARCIDSHCPGHSWATIDRWNARAPAPPSEGIRKLGRAAVEYRRVVDDPATWQSNSSVPFVHAENDLRNAVQALTPADLAACEVAE